MSTRGNTAITLFLCVGLLAFLSLPGCTRHRVPDENQMQMGQGSMGQGSGTQVSQAPQVSQVPQGPRFVTQSGRDYYVDSRGALHLITRQVIESPGAAGGLYYIEDDDRPYYRDPSNRLYYRDPSNRTYYIEDVRPGRSETVIIQREPERYAPVARSMESCESQWQSCMSGCNGISPRQPYDKPNCIRNCDIIRNGCLGR